MWSYGGGGFVGVLLRAVLLFLCFATSGTSVVGLVSVLVLLHHAWKGTAREWDRKDNKRVLLVISHPDDEAMFFIPLLRTLLLDASSGTASGTTAVFVLCLSEGDFKGQNHNNIRVHELYQSTCTVLGMARKHVTIAAGKHNSNTLRDGPEEVWDEKVVASHVAEAVRTHDIDCVVTFDANGVSNHPNHRATYAGVRHLFRQQEQQQEENEQETKKKQKQRRREKWRMYVLESVPLLRKYTSVVDAISTVVSGKQVFVSFKPWVSYRAMQAHASQFVWYRRLFVIFSRYTFINTVLEEK